MNTDLKPKTQTLIVNKLKLFFFLLLSLNCFTQTFEEIKKTDTIYILFKNKTEYEKKGVYPLNAKIGKVLANRIDYTFAIDNFYNVIVFIYSDYIDYDSYKKGIKSDVKIVRKSFLRKNKKALLDIDFFLKNGFKETFFAALYGKTVYLIDKEEFKKGKIKLKQVSVMSNYIEE